MHRKKPFSGKKKKMQLMAKRMKNRSQSYGEEISETTSERRRKISEGIEDQIIEEEGKDQQRGKNNNGRSKRLTDGFDSDDFLAEEDNERGGGEGLIEDVFMHQRNSKKQQKSFLPRVDKLGHQPGRNNAGNGNFDTNRYKLHFEYESKEEIEERKAQARLPLELFNVPNHHHRVDEEDEGGEEGYRGEEDEVEEKNRREKEIKLLTISMDDVYEFKNAKSPHKGEQSPALVSPFSSSSIAAAPAVIDIPKRPAWTYEMSKAQVERNEEAMFKKWLLSVYEQAGGEAKKLSYFEHNLETWRQLWRVLEISDEVLLIGDVRHPVLHFPPALFRYVREELRKPITFVLNKVDLVPWSLSCAWKKYFEDQFPGLQVVLFSAYPNSSASQALREDNDAQNVIIDGHLTTGERGLAIHEKRLQKRRKRGGGIEALGVNEVFSACQKHYDQYLKDKRGETEGKGKGISEVLFQRGVLGGDSGNDDVEEMGRGEGGLMGEYEADYDDDDYAGKDKSGEVPQIMKGKRKSTPSSSTRSKYISIGIVGHPNVGKSAIINGLMGRKVVSSSRTPGHTKHFQTIFLNKQVRLVDCPGMVFPSFVCRPLQILSGIYPISQVKEPYSSIGYLAQRVPLIYMLKLKVTEELTEGSSVKAEEFRWSAWSICEAWAYQRQFLTARAGRPDVYRAANHILRMVVDGRIVMAFFPPSYEPDKGRAGRFSGGRGSPEGSTPAFTDFTNEEEETESSEEDDVSDQDESPTEEAYSARGKGSNTKKKSKKTGKAVNKVQNAFELLDIE
eukprot:Nk52_evm46s485 gene=Nk52_evmTU46s485